MSSNEFEFVGGNANMIEDREANEDVDSSEEVAEDEVTVKSRKKRNCTSLVRNLKLMRI